LKMSEFWLLASNERALDAPSVFAVEVPESSTPQPTSAQESDVMRRLLLTVAIGRNLRSIIEGCATSRAALRTAKLEASAASQDTGVGLASVATVGWRAAAVCNEATRARRQRARDAFVIAVARIVVGARIAVRARGSDGREPVGGALSRGTSTVLGYIALPR